MYKRGNLNTDIMKLIQSKILNACKENMEMHNLKLFWFMLFSTYTFSYVSNKHISFLTSPNIYFFFTSPTNICLFLYLQQNIYNFLYLQQTYIFFDLQQNISFRMHSEMLSKEIKHKKYSAFTKFTTSNWELQSIYFCLYTFTIF